MAITSQKHHLGAEGCIVTVTVHNPFLKFLIYNAIQ